MSGGMSFTQLLEEKRCRSTESFAELVRNTQPENRDALRAGTYNVFNFNFDSHRLRLLAKSIALNMKAPHILALQEVRGHNRFMSGYIDAKKTLEALINTIEELGGPRYAYTYISPAEDGEDGSKNIHQVFLYDPTRVTLHEAEHGAPDEAVDIVKGADGKVHLSANPGRIHPEYACFAGTSKPLAAEFVDNVTGENVFAVNVHLVSKWTREKNKDKLEKTTKRDKKRAEQASVVGSFTDALMEELSANAENANIIIAGDFNSEPHEEPVRQLSERPYLNNLADGLEAGRFYTYVYRGQRQAPDGIIVSDDLAEGASAEAVRINAGMHKTTASDHNPVVAEFYFGREAAHETSRGR